MYNNPPKNSCPCDINTNEYQRGTISFWGERNQGDYEGLVAQKKAIMPITKTEMS